MQAWIKKHIFIIYTLIAFSISWIGWLIIILTDTSPEFFNPWKILAAFGPSLAGILAITVHSGQKGLQKVWRSLLGSGRPKWTWYLISLVLPPLLMVASLGIHILLGGQNLVFNDPNEIYRVIPVFVLVFFFSVLGEEIGWRGFALPWLQKRFSAFQSSLILGFLWSLWHLPLFWIPGDFHQQLPLIWFFIQTISLTIFYTWIFNGTNGSLLIILLLHSASNTAFGVLPMLPESADGSLRPAWILNILLIIAASLLVLINGSNTLTKGKPKQTLK